MAVTSDENQPAADDMKNVPESTGNSQKTTEVNASYQEEVRFQMTSTGEEKKQSSSKNSIVMLIIVAVFSMAVGAAGGILVYRETLETVPTPQTEAPVVEGQNQERLGATRTYFGTQPHRPTLTPGTQQHL
ncbi:uncharacterized protein LOC144625766 [Crassostrea virginica]